MKRPIITLDERNRVHLDALVGGPVDVTDSGFYRGVTKIIAALSTDRFIELARRGCVAVKQAGDIPVYAADLKMMMRGAVRLQLSITALGRHELAELALLQEVDAV